MYNQTEAVLAQYEIEIKQTTKGRGSYICDTETGKKVLLPFRGSVERGEGLKQYLENLFAAGFETELILPNKEGKAVTTDEISAEKFILKTLKEGPEPDVSRWEDVKAGAELLGRYHRLAKGMKKEELPEIFFETAISVIDNKKKHYRELIKIRNHIRTKKKKNEFERLFMDRCGPMMDTALRSIEMLEEKQPERESYCICHGDYNQHNVVRQNGKWYMIHMESITYGLPEEDLANYLRKVMEKNGWDPKLGEGLIEAYEGENPLSNQEKRSLCALLMFPERFWKITNHYMNSHKAWISQRDIEKLKKVIMQEEYRMEFLDKQIKNKYI